MCDYQCATPKLPYYPFHYQSKTYRLSQVNRYRPNILFCVVSRFESYATDVNCAYLRIRIERREITRKLISFQILFCVFFAFDFRLWHAIRASTNERFDWPFVTRALMENQLMSRFIHFHLCVIAHNKHRGLEECGAAVWPTFSGCRQFRNWHVNLRFHFSQPRVKRVFYFLF